MRRCLNGHPVFDDRRSVCACGAPLRGGTAVLPDEGQWPDDVGGGSAASDRPAPVEHADQQREPVPAEAGHKAEAAEGEVGHEAHEGPAQDPDAQQDLTTQRDPEDEGPIGGGTERHRTEALSAGESGGVAPGPHDAPDSPDAPDARGIDRPTGGAQRRRRSGRDRGGPRRRLSTLGRLVVGAVVLLLLLLLVSALGLLSSGSSARKAGTGPASARPSSAAPRPSAAGQVGPVLGVGTSGAGVTRLQKALAAAGFSAGAADGAFGQGTEAMLRAFQSAKGIPVTGRSDAATWAALPTVR